MLPQKELVEKPLCRQWRKNGPRWLLTCVYSETSWRASPAVFVRTKETIRTRLAGDNYVFVIFLPPAMLKFN